MCEVDRLILIVQLLMRYTSEKTLVRVEHKALRSITNMYWSLETTKWDTIAAPYLHYIVVTVAGQRSSVSTAAIARRETAS